MSDVVYAWGHNADGQLGTGNVTNSSLPVNVKGVGNIGLLTAIKAVSASRHSLALGSNGKVYAWGLNKQGQVGDATNVSPRTVPVQVGLLNSIKAISAGRLTFQLTSHSLALASNGTVYAWGSNEAGQLGNGTTTSTNQPVSVLGGLKDIVDVSGGRATSLALASNGTVFAWGDNTYGQLGNNSNTPSKIPIQVSLLTNIKAISASFHNLALRSDGVVFAWGLNISGQLGDDTTTSAKTPVQVKGLSNIVAVSTGVGHSLALRSDGKVFAWGLNDNGQLGNDDVIGGFSKTAVQVEGGLVGVVAIYAGDYESYALRADGELFAWGNNMNGQLGNGTTTSSIIPKQVANLNGTVVMSMGNSYALALR